VSKTRRLRCLSATYQASPPRKPLKNGGFADLDWQSFQPLIQLISVVQVTFAAVHIYFLFIQLNTVMLYEFDHSKSESNLAKHGVMMTDILYFEWSSALMSEDRRKPYAELRYEALGLIEGRLYVTVFCHRGEKVRVISLRKANSREVTRYAAKKQISATHANHD
jgi:uncharacterized DUF497 family protein